MQYLLNGGKKKTDRIEWIISFLFVLSPILQHHKGLYINGGWTALLLGLPLVLIQIVRHGIRINEKALIAFGLMALYQGYIILDHGFSMGGLIRTFILMVYFFRFSEEGYEFRCLVSAAAFVSLAACAGLIAQYFSYYILSRKLQFLSVRTFLDENNRWAERVSSLTKTGSFYRPSAFFMEPSHMFIYSFPSALYFLFTPDLKKKARLIGMIIVGGILLSTSGMGIVFSVGSMVAYYTMYKNPQYRKGSLLNFLMPKTMVILMLALIILAYLYNHVDLVRRAVIRILFEDEKGYNALRGRTTAGKGMLSTMSGTQYLIGVTDAMGEDGTNMSGFQVTFYKYGLIGILLSYVYYLYGLARTRNCFQYLCLILLVISFVCAHTHGTFYMLFYYAFISEGYKKKKERLQISRILEVATG